MCDKVTHDSMQQGGRGRSMWRCGSCRTACCHLKDPTPSKMSEPMRSGCGAGSWSSRMFGEGRHPHIQHIYETRLAPFLSQSANTFWQSRLWYFQNGLYYQGGMVRPAPSPTPVPARLLAFAPCITRWVTWSPSAFCATSALLTSDKPQCDLICLRHAVKSPHACQHATKPKEAETRRCNG